MTAPPIHGQFANFGSMTAPFGPPMNLWSDGSDHHQIAHHQQSGQHMLNARPPPPDYAALHQAQSQPVLTVGENKPRLTKDQADRLEGVFQQEYKPSTAKKRELAHEMGVGIEKINNWFQNRRAKSKQDKKKEQNALNNPYPANHTLGQQPFVTATSTNVASLPMEHMQCNTNLNSQGFGSPPSVSKAAPLGQVTTHVRANPEFSQGLQSISESAQPGSVANIYASLARGGYPLDPQNPMAMGDLPNQSQMVGYVPQPQIDSAVTYMDNFGQFDFTNMPPVYPSISSELDNAAFTSMSMPGETTAPLQSIETNDSIPPEMPLLSNPTSASAASSTNPSLEPVSPGPTYGRWNDDHKMVKSDSATNFVGSSPQSLSHVQSTADIGGIPGDWMTLPADSEFQLSSFYQQSNCSNQIFVSAAPNEEDYISQQRLSSLEEQPLPLPAEAFSRRTSSATALAENMSAVGLQSHSSHSSLNADFKQPSASNLALRRQRRPAQLQSSAFRSASYSSGMPTSPGQNPSIASEHTLRRIRSTGIAAASVGRVQKNSGSAQRSPLAFTFADSGAPSPRLMRNASYVAGFPQRNGSLAPPTPATPNEGARFPPWQPPVPQRSESFSTGFTNADNMNGQWIGGQITASQTVTSPPETPMDKALHDQLQNYQLQTQQWRDTPPQSAPALQQSFPQASFMPPPPPPAMYGSPNSKGLGPVPNRYMHGRRPSAPDAAVPLGNEHQLQYPYVPVFDATGQLVSVPVEQLSTQQMQPMPAQPSYIYSLQQGNQQTFAQSGNIAVSMSTPPQGRIDQPLVFQEYTPPPGSEKFSPPQPRQTEIKKYTFENKNPSDFSSPS